MGDKQYKAVLVTDAVGFMGLNISKLLLQKGF
mgnify:CR=1 FL=1